MSDNKPNTFALFRNDKKTSDNQPDYRGRMTDADGVDWELSAWVKTSKAGMSYLGGTLKEPYNKPATDAAPPTDDFLTPTAAATPEPPIYNLTPEPAAPQPEQADLPF